MLTRYNNTNNQKKILYAVFKPLLQHFFTNSTIISTIIKRSGADRRERYSYQHLQRVLYIFIFIFTSFCISGNSSMLYAKTKSEYKENRSLLFEELEVAKQLLTETQKDKAVSLNGLLLLEKQILSRNAIIENLNEHLTLINHNIRTVNHQIDSIQQQLSVLKKDYASSVRKAYLFQNTYSKLLFLFSAKDFNDAYKRFKFMQYYRDYRKKQMEQIAFSKGELEAKLLTLETEKIEKTELLTTTETEKKQLQINKKEEQKFIKKLKKKEFNLLQQLEAKEAALTELDKLIQQTLGRELVALHDAKDRGTYGESGKKKENKTIPVFSEAEINKMSKAFANYKGKMAWPVKDGVITAKFGRRKHPVLRNITTSNNGIDITTKPDANVRVLFEGRVTNIFYNPSFQWALIVRHGDYYTVYANLEKPVLTKGDEVERETLIGKVHNNEDTGTTKVHLEVWKGGTKLNPAKWLTTSNSSS